MAGYQRMQDDNTDMDKPPIVSQPGPPPPTYQEQAYPGQQPGYPSQQVYPAQYGYPQQPVGYMPQQHIQQPYPGGQTTATTNVVVVQQQPVGLQQRDWSSGMCACFDDIGSCCLGFFCPCFLLIDVSQRMGEGCCFPFCCAGALIGLRIKMRIAQNIQGSLMDDYCVSQCCPLCVTCQLARELTHLGR